MAEAKDILIIEDEIELSATIAEELASEGFSVDVAHDGQQALSMLSNEHYELAVLDLKLPKVDGFTVLKHIKEHLSETKVIVLTAYADLKNVTKAKSLGADDVIEKPYDLGDLIDAIHFVLGGRKSLQ